jgi:hypothetical protein
MTKVDGMSGLLNTLSLLDKLLEEKFSSLEEKTATTTNHNARTSSLCSNRYVKNRRVMRVVAAKVPCGGAVPPPVYLPLETLSQVITSTLKLHQMAVTPQSPQQNTNHREVKRADCINDQVCAKECKKW